MKKQVNEPHFYKLDFDKITTLEDVINILKALDLLIQVKENSTYFPFIFLMSKGLLKDVTGIHEGSTIEKVETDDDRFKKFQENSFSIGIKKEENGTN